MKTEPILVFPTSYVDFEGVMNDSEKTLEYLNNWKDKFCFMPRYMAEEWPEWKQLIPYILVSDGEKYFITQRTNKGGEERLHNQYSLGIGGHIDIWDAVVDLVSGEEEYPAYGALPIGTAREFNEELEISEQVYQDGDFEILGLMNDNSNEVSKVHLAIITRTIVPEGAVQVRETDKLIGQWMSIDEIEEIYDNLESWSQLVFSEILKKG